MLRFAFGVFALMLTFAQCVAEAQPPGSRSRGRGPFGGRRPTEGYAALLAVREVQTELGLTSQQQQLLDALQSDLRDQRRTLRSGFGSSPGSDGQRFEAMARGIEQFNRNADQLVETILEPDQTERLRQIDVQRSGTRALEKPRIAKSLGLSDSQLERIRMIRQLARNSNGDESTRRRTRIDSGTLTKDILAVLTVEQQAQWEKLKGQEFKFPNSFSRFGRRGFGGRPSR